MNITSDAIKEIEQALTHINAAIGIINNLIVPHDYQDVAVLVARASAEMLTSTKLLMENQGDDALDALERADDLLDAVYDIIDAETDED